MNFPKPFKNLKCYLIVQFNGMIIQLYITYCGTKIEHIIYLNV
jgi:hypothetical protein